MVEMWIILCAVIVGLALLFGLLASLGDWLEAHWNRHPWWVEYRIGNTWLVRKFRSEEAARAWAHRELGASISDVGLITRDRDVFTASYTDEELA